MDMSKEVLIKESLADRSINSLEEEISELEDTYADCLKDEVESSILKGLWGRIKELKKELCKRDRK
jgi:hypothetical protein